MMGSTASRSRRPGINGQATETTVNATSVARRGEPRLIMLSSIYLHSYNYIQSLIISFLMFVFSLSVFDLFFLSLSLSSLLCICFEASHFGFIACFYLSTPMHNRVSEAISLFPILSPTKLKPALLNHQRINKTDV